MQHRHDKESRCACRIGSLLSKQHIGFLFSLLIVFHQLIIERYSMFLLVARTRRRRRREWIGIMSLKKRNNLLGCEGTNFSSDSASPRSHALTWIDAAIDVIVVCIWRRRCIWCGIVDVVVASSRRLATHQHGSKSIIDIHESITHTLHNSTLLYWLDNPSCLGSQFL